MSSWIDVSVSLYTGMVHWPDNPPVHFERMKDMDKGDNCNVSVFSMGSHTGTHMDAPLHFVNGAQGIDKMPLEATIGPARVIEIKDTESIKPDDLRQYELQAGERVLFKTSNSTRCWGTNDFIQDFVYISTEAAQYFAELHLQTIGVDYLSVGGYKKNGTPAHQAILNAGIWVIEGLNLSQVQPGRYEMICLPLKVLNGDGAPARAILRPLE